MGVWPEAGPQSEPVLAVERPKIGLSHAMSLLSTQRFGQGTKNLGNSSVRHSTERNALTRHWLRRRKKAPIGGSHRGEFADDSASWTGWEAAIGPRGDPRDLTFRQAGFIEPAPGES